MKTIRCSRRTIITAVVLLAVILMVLLRLSRFPAADRDYCVANLKQIDGAIMSISLENRLYVGDPVPLKRVAECLRGHRLPTCPSGGHYVIALVGDTPVCSYHGDLLTPLDGPVGLSTNVPAKWFLFRELQSPTFSTEDVADFAALAGRLMQPARAVDQYLYSRLSPATVEALAKFQGADFDPVPLRTVLLRDLNNIVHGPLLYTKERFAGVVLRTETALRLPMRPQGDELVSLNRLLLEDAYPTALAKSGRSK